MSAHAPGDQAPDHDAGQHGPAVVVGQLRRGERAHAGEGDLAEPEHAALAGDEGPRQEDDAVGEGLGRAGPPSTRDDHGQGACQRR